jgi:saccharopine dehydrogenase (NAD+, L-lysine-forming)
MRRGTSPRWRINTIQLRRAIADIADRSALTPTTTKALIDAGYKVNVERSPQRIFDDEEYEKVGATLVPEDTWRDAPEDSIIVGLKELPVETCESMYKDAVDAS